MKIILILACIILAFSQDSTSVFYSLNQTGIGKFRLGIQSLNMLRDYESNADYYEYSGSVASTFQYQSPEFSGFSLLLEHVYGKSYLSESDIDIDAAKHMSNNNFHILNQFYLAYSLFKNSFIRIGRQSLKNNFTSLYPIRQKNQAFEAIRVEINEIDRLNISFGYLNRFSNWKATNNFDKIKELEGLSESSYSYQYIDIKYKSDNYEFNIYDLYGKNLYNTLAIYMDRKISILNNWGTDLRLRYVKQNSNGSFTDLNADAFQIGFRFKKDGFTIEPGYFFVTGDENKNQLRTPFQPYLIVEEPMYESDLGFKGGAKTRYIESTYNSDSNSLYILFLNSKEPVTEQQVREFDLIYKKTFFNRFYISFKTAWVEYLEKNKVTNHVRDYRIIFGLNL